MEDASKALLMAGGILLAMLTLGLLVAMFNNISTMQNANADTEEARELAAWNAQWEAYNKPLLHGTEILTVINKAEQNNTDDSLYKVTVKVENNDHSRIELNNTTFSYRRKF